MKLTFRSLYYKVNNQGYRLIKEYKKMKIDDRKDKV